MTISLDAVVLPEDLIWTDEYLWTPIKQTTERGLTGANIIDSGVKTAGRSITLVGEPNWVECPRSLLNTLHAKLADNAEMILTLHDARQFTVRFDHQSTPIQSEPVIDFNNPEDSDENSITLRFITI